MNTLKQLKEKISDVNFHQLYPGFKQYTFALYNQDSVFFEEATIPWTTDFIGNTSIKYKGEQIAIWDLHYKIDDLDVFASKIVHEMFHAHQLTLGETRFPDELKGLDYRYTKESISLLFHETKRLIEAVKHQKKEVFQDYLSLRKYRKSLYPMNVGYEDKIALVEGSARFVELMALRQLNDDTYQRSLEETFAYLSDPKNYLSIRKTSYDIGALVLVYCKEHAVFLDWSIKGKVETYFDLLLRDVKVLVPDEEALKLDTDFLDAYKKKEKILIQEIIDQPREVIKGDKLVGFDPMNLVKTDGYYRSSHMIKILKGQEEVTILGHSVFEYKEGGVIVYKS